MARRKKKTADMIQMACGITILWSRTHPMTSGIRLYGWLDLAWRLSEPLFLEGGHVPRKAALVAL